MYRIHHLPPGEIGVTQFETYINGEKTLPWYCRVSAVPYNTVWQISQRPVEQSEIASFISFESDEAVNIRLIACKDFKEIIIRPLSKHIVPQVNGREITFTIEQVGQYTVELDGWHNALHIFANPYTDFGVDKSNPKVRYYAPGIYNVGNIELEDGETLYIDGGAVLYGSVSAIHKKNIRIVGYGVIDGSLEQRTSASYGCAVNEGQCDLTDEATLRAFLKEKNVMNGCVRLYSCTDSELNGIITRDCALFAYVIAGCERLNCEWIKTIGMWRYNSDGIDLFNCSYVRITNSFLRNFDDCIVLKGMKGWDTLDQHHITVTGCTVWCDWGRCLEVGAETCANEYYDILWDDCDLIHGAHVFIDIQNTDRAHIHDMLVRNIRCEYSAYDLLPVYQHDVTVPYNAFGKPWHPTLIASPISNGMWSKDNVPGETNRIRFEDIRVLAPENLKMPICDFNGCDSSHCNHDIVIENIVLNGRRLRPEEIMLKTSEFDHDITVL